MCPPRRVRACGGWQRRHLTSANAAQRTIAEHVRSSRVNGITSPVAPGNGSPAVTAAGAVGNGILVQLNHGATETAPELAVLCRSTAPYPPSICNAYSAGKCTGPGPDPVRVLRDGGPEDRLRPGADRGCLAAGTEPGHRRPDGGDRRRAHHRHEAARARIHGGRGAGADHRALRTSGHPEIEEAIGPGHGVRAAVTCAVSSELRT